jgi:hypothetical protein
MTTKQKKQKQIQLPETRKDFINFFKDIPDRRWCTGSLGDGKGRYCAVGHLNHFVATNLVKSGLNKGTYEYDDLFTDTKERLEKNFKKAYKTDVDDLMEVNDNIHKKFNASTLKTKKIKTRVLAFLKR